MGYDDTQYLKILRDTWGYSDFRGIQRDIIRSIAEGKDSLGLMPTGGGKSLTFQVPALAMDGVCIVITPLIALMKDQVENLRRHKVLAAAIYSGMSRHDIVKTLENCVLGNTKVLYVSPERINTELFQTKLAHINVSFITIDEAHCISQWGYDFRPSYLHIADIRRIKPDAPLLALTATATTEVIDDIQKQLEFKEKNVFRMSFERKNLAYVVRTSENKLQQLVHILNSINGSAIVYVRSRKLTKEICEFLLNNSISATYYHAGLEHSTKDERQKKWHDGEVRVMVATNAFGMGIDKSDVRVVVHITCPDSIEAYFQEAGRAGRDGKKAYAVLLYDKSDKAKLLKRIAQEFPPKDEISRVYEHIAYYLQIAAGTGYGRTFNFEIEKFCHLFHHYPTIVNSALKILSRAGYFEYDIDPDSRTRVKFTLERDQLYMLHDMTPNEDAVITTLLREYSGLFVDYHFIELAYIAHTTGLTQQQVYLILSSLSQRRILHFIPERSVPLLTYTKDRVLQEEIIIPETIYEERKAQFERRIKSIIDYAQNDMVCRSRQLLRYFGETDSNDCRQCDVCLAHQDKPQSYKDAYHKSLKAIKSLLADGKKHPIVEINKIVVNQEAKDEALEYLVNEEVIKVELNNIYLKKVT